jgi:exosortase
LLIVDDPADDFPPDWARPVRRYGDWIVAGALALFLLPDIVKFAHSYWLSDRGLHGAIILGLGIWLLAREWPRGAAERGNIRVVAPALFITLCIHTLATVIGSHWLIWITSCAGLALIVFDRLGMDGLRRLWFPLGFLLLAVPPSGRIMSKLTYVLTDWLSAASVELLWQFGWDIARNRTTIYLGPYELLVADACAGLNALLSLFAMGMFFLYIRRDSPPWRLATLAALMLPIVFLTGLARTLALLLMTDSFGDGVAQGVMHEVTGVLMFVLAFAMFVGVDWLLPRSEPVAVAA